MRATVTGGAGYIGALLVAELTTGGWDVTVLDSLLHGQATVARAVAGLGAHWSRATSATRRRAAARSRASTRSSTSPRSSAIPRARATRALATRSTSRATQALLADAARPASRRFVFASTCSNYGRMDDPTVPITRTASWRRCRCTRSRRSASRRRCCASGDRATRADLPALRDGLRRRRRGCAST